MGAFRFAAHPLEHSTLGAFAVSWLQFRSCWTRFRFVGIEEGVTGEGTRLLPALLSVLKVSGGGFPVAFVAAGV